MGAVSKATFLVPASPVDAYRQWKSFLGLAAGDHLGDGACSVIEDVPEKSVHWLSRWGVGQIDGRAEFIPAQGGCVLYLKLAGVGVLSRLMFSTLTPLDRGVWHYMSRFWHFADYPAALSKVRKSSGRPAQ